MHLGYDPSIPNLWEFLDRGKFSIDGPGGESIDAVYVAVQHYSNDEACHPHFSQGVPQRYMVWKEWHYTNIRAISSLIPNANGIQISTNRSRFWLFQDHGARELRTREEAEKQENLQFKKLEITPGTTIIGFYAVKVSFRVSLTLFLGWFICKANRGLENLEKHVFSLGVISAAINGQNRR